METSMNYWACPTNTLEGLERLDKEKESFKRHTVPNGKTRYKAVIRLEDTKVTLENESLEKLKKKINDLKEKFEDFKEEVYSIIIES